jgi:hypothetical protein
MVSSGRSHSFAFLAAALGLVFASCGGPTSPSGVAVLRGTVLDETAGASQAVVSEAAGVSAQSTASSSSAANVTVSVQEAPELTATVAKDGTFTLSGLPTGTVTLLFSRNGRELGRLTIEDVLAGEQLDIKVKVRGNGVTLLDLQRSSPGPSPSPTASPSPSPSASPSGACMISGGQAGAAIELEGSVSEGTAASFMLLVQGNRSAGPVTVDASGAAFQCHPASGPNAPTPAACKASVSRGAKVHVSGSLEACDASTASATARKVIVQQAGG